MSCWLLLGMVSRDYPNFHQAIGRLFVTRDTESDLPFEHPLFLFMRLIIIFFHRSILSFGILGLLFGCPLYSPHVTKTPC